MEEELRNPLQEARQLLVEICYRLNYRKKSLREIGRELGGISGEQITQIHNLEFRVWPWWDSGGTPLGFARDRRTWGGAGERPPPRRWG